MCPYKYNFHGFQFNVETQRERNKLHKFRNHYAYSVTFWSHCAKFEDIQLDSFTQCQKKKNELQTIKNLRKTKRLKHLKETLTNPRSNRLYLTSQNTNILLCWPSQNQLFDLFFSLEISSIPHENHIISSTNQDCGFIFHLRF